ncbi:MAG: RsmE family RNA methyltransferase [Candidatus Pelagibacter sp.]|tara:strand:+ start:12 stop:713 length:702 start_codon:yes stop_codon:yes gene_type:complete
MSNIRLFFSESLSINLKSKLDKTQSHYISKVMRIKVGENFILFNQSGEYKAKVENLVKGFVEFSIVKKLRSADASKEIWLAFTPIKLNYLNLMIQKATELGVTKFMPIITERTIVRKINEKRIRKIIIEASEQSNRLNLPELDKLKNLDEFIKENAQTTVIFGDLNSNNKKINIKGSDPICILIGPEGDFSVKERENISKLKKIIPLNINQNILRSETAAISMISIISFILLS